jgi:hypothetical protein
MPTSSELQLLASLANTTSSGLQQFRTPDSFVANRLQQANAVVQQGQSSNPTAAMAATSSSANILRYPLDGGVYAMSFIIHDYVRPSMLQPLQLNPQQIIVLPLPSELIDAQQISYTPRNRSPMVGVASENLARTLSGSSGQGTPGASAGAFQQLGEAIQGTAGAVGGLGLEALRAIMDIGPDFGSAIAQQLGQAPNPFLTVEFTSPNFKEHTFTWKFSPRDPQESTRIKEIINKLKYASLPSLNNSLGAVFMNYPSIIKPILIPNAQEMYFMKYSVITNIVVNWAPSGTPAFFTGTKAPVEIQLMMNLLEIELHLKDNYQPIT